MSRDGLSSKVPANQEGVRHGPGRFRALLTFDPPTVEEGRQAVAALLTELESIKLRGDGHSIPPKLLKVVVGVSLPLLEGHPEHANLLQEVPAGWKDRDHADVVVQIAAETEDERTYAYCLIERVFGAHKLALRQQLHGGKHVLGREPFGYRDTETPEIAPDVQLRWMLFQDCVQDLSAFYSRSVEEQHEVVGRERDPRDGENYEVEAQEGSHLAVARALEREGRPLIRRSIGYREYGKAGLAFLATASKPNDLTAALEAFVARDRLHAFVTLRAKGLYFLPPTAAWLSADPVHVRPYPVPPGEPAQPEDAFFPSHPLHLYEMTPASLRFFRKVFHQNHMNFNERGDLRPDLLLLAKGMAKLLYGGRIPKSSKLYKLLARLFEADTTPAALPEIVHESDPLCARVEKMATARARYDEKCHTTEAKYSADLTPKEVLALDAEVDAHEREFRNAIAADETELRSLLKRDARRTDAVLGADASDLADTSISDLIAEMVIQDAQAIHALPAATKHELANIVEDCRAGSREAAALNRFAGRYMTFTC